LRWRGNPNPRTIHTRNSLAQQLAIKSMGAPVGNQNAAKAKIVSDAIRKALAAEDWKRLRAGAEKVADSYANGEPWAVQFVADRMDGKAVQATEVSGPEGGPVQVSRIERLIVENAKASDT
jgi:hypothetical protein